MNIEIEKLLADSAKGLMEHQCKTVPKERLHLPGPDFVDRIFALSDRIIVLCGGRVTGERLPEDTNPQDLGLLTAGVNERAA